MQGAQLWSLGRELRSHMLQAVAKKKMSDRKWSPEFLCWGRLRWWVLQSPGMKVTDLSYLRGSGLPDRSMTFLSERYTCTELNLNIVTREAPRMIKMFKSKSCEEQGKEPGLFCWEGKVQKRHEGCLWAVEGLSSELKGNQWIVEAVISNNLSCTHQKNSLQTKSVQTKTPNESWVYIVIRQLILWEKQNVYSSQWLVYSIKIFSVYFVSSLRSSFLYDFQRCKQEMTQVKLVLQNKLN